VSSFVSVSCVYALVFVCLFFCLTVLETTLSSTSSVVSVLVRGYMQGGKIPCCGRFDTQYMSEYSSVCSKLDLIGQNE
jgi:hypothetical protein